MSGDGHCHDFAQVAADEAAWIARRRQASGLPADTAAVGLALSGGGIRSAVFNLGLLQALHSAGLLRQVDYLSSVSGGGYVAGCLSWLRHTVPGWRGCPFQAPLADGSGTVLDWLRLNGKFLIAAPGFSMWTLVAAILASTLLNLLVLAPLLIGLLWLLGLPWWPAQWPHWLALPGMAAPQDHDGYWLALRGGLWLLAAFPALAVLAALLIGTAKARSDRLMHAIRLLLGQVLALACGLLALGTLPLASRLGDALVAGMDDGLLRLVGGHLDWGLAIVAGLTVLLAGRGRARRGRQGLAIAGLALLLYGVVLLGYHLAVQDDVVATPAFATALALSVLLAFTCDLNRVSMFAYYRARLVGSFLPTVAGGGAQRSISLRMDRLDPDSGAPLPLVNTTLNTFSSPDARRRARGGASFFVSPLWLGSDATGFRRSADYAGDAATLASALTISAAAIDPDTHVTRNRALSALMALLNVRLGFWALNPLRHRSDWLPRPRWWLFIAREMLGIGLSERHRHVHLADGGHFDNLGLYELVRRRVPNIVVSDAGADPDLDFGDLGRAIERVRVDFGAEIELAVDSLAREREAGLATRPWRLGTIRYADGSAGRILYLRPMMAAGLSADIYTWWRGHPSFPDESTANQFFGEAQFEAYRALGFELAGRLLAGAPTQDIVAWFDHLAGLERAG
ncbi:MAG: hypothetical protein KF823_13290 [Xanthomonadales bacterium]|nr:hypothetical protein [Xanthomonadales bacterium]